MAEDEEKAVQGSQRIGFVRLLKEAEQLDASHIVLDTSMDYEISRDTDTKKTKSNNVTTSSLGDIKASWEEILGDYTINDKMKSAILNGDLVEFWRVNVARTRVNADGKTEVYADYMRGLLSSYKESADADDASTNSYEIAVEGKPKSGWITLTDEQTQDIDYLFRGVQKYDEETNGGGEAVDDGSGTTTTTSTTTSTTSTTTQKQG